MSLTPIQHQFYDYCAANEFLDASTLEQFKQRLQAEGNSATFLYQIEKFITQACPNCQVTGMFKWHFLGKLEHPACQTSWYASPATYITRQLRDTFLAGRNFAGHTSEKGSGIEGFFFGLLGFLVGVSFRLPITLLMIPIQAVVSLSQATPAPALPQQQSAYTEKEAEPELSYEDVRAVEQFVINYLENHSSASGKALYRAMLAEAGNQYDEAIQELDRALCSQISPELALIGYRLLTRVIWLKFNFGNRDGQTISDEEALWCDRANKAANKAVAIYTSTISQTDHPKEFYLLYLICKEGVEMTLLYFVTKRDAYGNVSFRELDTYKPLPPLRCIE